MQETQAPENTVAAPAAAPIWPQGLPTAIVPAVGGQWPRPQGRYLDHNHPLVISAAFAYYASGAGPVSRWAESVGFQHSGVLKNAMNRELRKIGLPTFTRQTAAIAAASMAS